MTTREVNFDGIVGPTHHYAGLAFGNVASQMNAGDVAHPRAAALQGLDKMKFCMDLGLVQAVLPPQERPNVWALRDLGFAGSDREVIERAWREAPRLAAAVCSASSMWAANAATIAPSADTADAADARLHITPANLHRNFHRSIEAATTTRILRAIFADAEHFAVHDPLPATPWFGDEGAANHTRLAPTHAARALQLFTYGRTDGDDNAIGQPRRYPARQTLLSSQAIARRHRVKHAHYVQQHPVAIDEGVFHNDVIAVGNEDVFLAHERAYAHGEADFNAIKQAYRNATGDPLRAVIASEEEVTLSDAIASYLFNSQLVTLPVDNDKPGDIHDKPETHDAHSMALLFPAECQAIPSVEKWVTSLPQREPRITQVHPMNVRQSMRNGGGPACLRLRVVMTHAQRDAAAPGVFLDATRHQRLIDWVNKHYREELRGDDLRDPKLLVETRDALDELTQMLELGNLYRFQDG